MAVSNVIEYVLVPPNVAMVIQALNLLNAVQSQNKRAALEREQKWKTSESITFVITSECRHSDSSAKYIKYDIVAKYELSCAGKGAKVNRESEWGNSESESGVTTNQPTTMVT
jgi:hypothetical protein